MSANRTNRVYQSTCLLSWRRLSTNRLALLPSLQHDMSIIPNFTTAQISLSALQEECEGILASAEGSARSIFAMGQTPADLDRVNWMIYWLLWQAKELLRLELSAESRRPESSTNNASSQPGGKGTSKDGGSVFWDPARNL